MFLRYAFPIDWQRLDSPSYSVASSSPSSAWSGDEQSRRSRSALATSLVPPSLVEGRISSAIQRRAVRIDTPVSRAMSEARRYSVPSVISASPEEGAVSGNHPPNDAPPIRERLAVQEDELAGSERGQLPPRVIVAQPLRKLRICPNSFARAKLFRIT